MHGTRIRMLADANANGPVTRKAVVAAIRAPLNSSRLLSVENVVDPIFFFFSLFIWHLGSRDYCANIPPRSPFCRVHLRAYSPCTPHPLFPQGGLQIFALFITNRASSISRLISLSRPYVCRLQSVSLDQHSQELLPHLPSMIQSSCVGCDAQHSASHMLRGAVQAVLCSTQRNRLTDLFFQRTHSRLHTTSDHEARRDVRLD